MQIKSSISARIVLLSVVFCIPASLNVLPTSAQTARQEVNLDGKVRNKAGEPMSGVVVTLESEKGATVQETRTSADGSYILKVAEPGMYRLRFQKDGYSPHIQTVELQSGKKHIYLSLSAMVGAGSGIEFSDSPNFAIAGVTDWSNVGLHGSDANVKTSEVLSKEAAALKSSAPASASGSGAGDVHRRLGDEKEKAGDPVAAVKEYEAAVNLDGSEENYFAWGTELLLHRAGLAAVQVLHKGADLHPKSERLTAALGAAYYANGQFTEAAEQMCRASDLNPADAEPYLFLGKMEQAASAISPCSEEKLNRFADKQPENAHAHFFYGLLLLKKARKTQSESDFDQAEKSFLRASAIEPKYGEVYVELGMLYNAQGKKEAALTEFQKAVAVSPESSAPHYQLSLAYRRAGEAARADEEMKIYNRLKQSEAAALEKERREMRQFVTVLKQGSSN